MDKTFTTPAGTTVHARSFKHKRGTLVGYTLELGAHPLVVTGTHHRVYREHYGFTHMTTAWATRMSGPHGEDHMGIKAARESALAYIDSLGCPEHHCRIHNHLDAASGQGDTARCESCTETARATAARLLAETSA